MDNGEYFTVSFYPESYRQLLLTLGSKSGRDINKMELPELTAKEVCNTVTFEEAEITVVCKKLFKQKLDPSNMLPEIAEQFYKGDAEHDMYIGEVVDIIR